MRALGSHHSDGRWGEGRGGWRPEENSCRVSPSNQGLGTIRQGERRNQATGVGTTERALLLDPYGFGIEKGWKRGEANEAALVTSLALGQAQSHLTRTATLYDGGCQLRLLVSPKTNLAISGELWI